jgi:hypothetical protein
MFAVFIAAYGRRRLGSRRASLEKVAAVVLLHCGADFAAEGLQMKFERRDNVFTLQFVAEDDAAEGRF